MYRILLEDGRIVGTPNAEFYEVLNILSTQTREGVGAKQSAAEGIIKKYIKEKWADDWKNGRHGSFLRQWLPEIETAKRAMKRYTGLSAAEAAALFQARVGKIGLNSFLSSIDRADTARCPCGEAPETVHHIIMQCDRYDDI